MTQEPTQERFGIEELARLGGVTRRTVRYYVKLGLLPTPTGTGRGKHYTAEHLASLRRIKGLQESGVSLAEIRLIFDGRQEPGSGDGEEAVQAVEVRRQEVWSRVELARGVELHLQGRSLSPRALDRLARSVHEILDEEEAV